MSKDMDFYHLQEICLTNMDTADKTRQDALKKASKKVLHKAIEASEFIGKEIAQKIVKTKPVSDENLREAEEIIIPLEKRE